MLAWQGCGQPEDLEELENTAEAWGDSCSALFRSGTWPVLHVTPCPEPAVGQFSSTLSNSWICLLWLGG